MFKNFKKILSFILASTVLGGLITTCTIRHFDGFGQKRYGPWIGNPKSSTEDSDPYEQAYEMTNSIFGYGKAEGLSLWIEQDTLGRKLTTKCTYRLKGSPLKTEFFTIYTTNRNLEPLYSGDNYPNALSSSQLIFENNNYFIVYISRYPHWDNWLSVPAKKFFRIVINLYNTPFVSPSGLNKLTMPIVERLYCGEPKNE